ncbi:MAG: hypothetical protein HOP15_17305 [Planctomycetes bacterium]|nr:hypothetical protein [Planctomycetota bacterium]
MGRRILRYALVGLVLFLLGGLWAFSFFFFNPFEGGYEYPISSLISREVDFYASKKQLRRDFDPFPKLAFLDEFEASPSGKAILELGVRARLESWEIDKSLAELERVLAGLPLRIDPLSVFGGQGLAVAGHFTGQDLADAKWAVYGRTSWVGKLAFELVAGGWVDLAAQGITLQPFEHEGEVLGVQLSGGQLARPIFLARIQDVAIVASDGAFLVEAGAFESKRGQDSFGLSAKYADNIARSALSGDELELYFDQRALAENLKLAGTWPDPRSTELTTALVAKLFQLGAVRELIGTTDFARALSLDFVAELSSNVLSPFQQRLYDQRGFDKEQLFEAARLAPADAGLFAYLHGDIGDLLRELRAVFMQIDPAAISNLEDFVRAAWNHSDLEPLIADLDEGLRDRVAFFARDYDYPEELGDSVPPHDDTPVYAWALVLWPKDQTRIDAIRKVLSRNDVVEMLKIQGATPGSSGLWENTLQGGAKVNEYWNVLVPGTGHVATLEMKGREPYLVLTNENRMLGQIFKAYNTGATEEGLGHLAKETAFEAWVEHGLASANLMVWFAPGAMADTTRRIVQRRVDESAADYIDWDVERPRIQREVLARDFPGEVWGNVSDENHDSYEMRVQEEAERFQANYLEQHLPELRAESETWMQASTAVRNSFFELATDRKRLRLHGRIGLGFLTEP